MRKNPASSLCSGEAMRRRRAPRSTRSCAPVPALGAQGVHGLQALVAGERVPGGEGENTCELEESDLKGRRGCEGSMRRILYDDDALPIIRLFFLFIILLPICGHSFTR
ncbi:hypothetical protein BC936DRAFT_136993 [Jimgerdemannia flammicorona]|uniref:Uncharacterized protein n=1 Tax=Jimgerdemannia flammicorona TaxID=994334 RepID=A0A433DJI7_9FUNG|nr:hypothetical protein BC936DRAFT_136993 [Jimgerdemannia flammicorona]